MIRRSNILCLLRSTESVEIASLAKCTCLESHAADFCGKNDSRSFRLPIIKVLTRGIKLPSMFVETRSDICAARRPFF